MVAALQDLSGDSWIHKNIVTEMERTIEQRIRWIQLRNGEPLPGVGKSVTVVWTQQGMLKELNEKLWDIGGTEFFLSVLDDELAILVKDPALKTHIVHRNYKDRVLVTGLSGAEYVEKVVEPWQERVAARLEKHHPIEGGWETFLSKSAGWGTGKSPEDAFFSLRNLSRADSPEEFSRLALENRALLSSALREAGLVWPEFLRAVREARGSRPALEAFARNSRLDESLIPRMLAYQDHVYMPDLLPVGDAGGEGELRALESALSLLKSGKTPPDAVIEQVGPLIRGSWLHDRTLFLRNTLQNGQFIIAGDVRGLGMKALLARDEWIAKGADFDQITRIYEGTTAELNRLIQEVVSDVRQALSTNGRVVGVYATGDDLMISVNGANNRQALEQALEARVEIYFHVTEIEQPGLAESVAEAVSDARTELFRKKDALKASARNPSTQDPKITWRIRKNSTLAPKIQTTPARKKSIAVPKQAPY
jgi:hypothetical protein